MASFTKVATAAEIPALGGKIIEAGGKQIAVFAVEGAYYAIDNLCTHRGGSLADGQVIGQSVVCPWHAAHFSLETGQALTPPASKPVACYPVRRTGDDIEVEI